MQRGIYTGRFQPFGLHHFDRLLELRYAHTDIAIHIGVADWRGDLTQSNFLRGDEAAEIVRLTLQDNKIDAEVHTLPVSPDIPLAGALESFAREFGFTALFSGSPKTINAAEMTERFRIIRINDDDTTGPRARDIRGSLIEGTSFWKEKVSPSVVPFIEELKLAERLRELPDGDKRPWRIAGETIQTTLSPDRR